MRVIFLGTPEFAVNALDMLNQNHQVVGVVTKIDKVVGRGSKTSYSPVKQYAIKHNLPLFQFKSIKKQGYEPLKQLNADVMVTCAYGQMLDQKILDITPIGVLNIHGSILPKYRGASPIQMTIYNGDKVGGITILRSEIGMDDGDILLTKKVDIRLNQTSSELFDELSVLGGQAIIEALQLIENNQAVFTKQDHTQAIHCSMLTREHAIVDFNNNAQSICNVIHALDMWPTVNFKIDDIVYKIYKAQVFDNPTLITNLDEQNFQVGQVVLSNAKQGLVIKCKNDYLQVTEMQAPNAKRMSAKSLLNGRKIQIGSNVESE